MLLRCRRCGEEKEAERHFYRRSDRPSGYQRECIECRKEIKKEAKERKQKEVIDEKIKDRQINRDEKKRRNVTQERHEKLMKQLSEKLIAGEVFGETPRTFHFAIKIILEQQLDLFYGRDITSPIGVGRKRKIINETLYEIQGVLSRTVGRMKLVEKAEPMSPLDNQLPGGRIERMKALAVLGLNGSATPEDIKRRYKELARGAHPDHGGSEERMAEINAAWSMLER